MKYSFSIFSILLGLALFITAFLISPPQTVVEAQCNGTSSCRSCHEIQKEKPVANSGPWHSNHSMYDFCAVCHGGDPKAAEKQQAHTGRVVLLKEMPSNCKNCHEADLEQKYNAYAQILGVAGSSPLQAAPSANNQGVTSFFGKQEVNPAVAEGCATSEPTPSGNLLFGAIFGVSLLGSSGYVVINEKRKRQSHA